ncbi:glycosyltransferase family 1 protein [Candidatus Woesearchaeota archaeon]|nr:MAG: glycosyltransferase family 1 protein [Candidatus Woesearchaeota archaeon]
MKLVYVLPKYDASAGEHFAHTYRLLEELGKHLDLAVVIEKCTGKPTFKNVKTVRIINEDKFLPRLAKTFKTLWNLRGKGYTKIYTHYSFYGALSARLVTTLRGGLTSYWNCGLPHLYFKTFGQKGWLTNKINDDWPLRLSLLFTNYLITGTKRMKHYYHNQFGVPLRKIIVIPNDIDLARFTPKPPPNNKTPVIFFVHRISERKGAHHLVPIAREVLAHTNAHFVIAGDGPYLPALTKLVKQHKLNKNFTLLGPVPNTQIMNYYATSDLFIMPSDEEGMPRVLLEAQAMGVPFVATDVGGVRDIIPSEQQDFVVPKGNTSLFAQKILQLLGDSSLRQKLRDAGLANVKKYNLPGIAKQTAELFKKQ